MHTSLWEKTKDIAQKREVNVFIITARRQCNSFNLKTDHNQSYYVH